MVWEWQNVDSSWLSNRHRPPSCYTHTHTQTSRATSLSDIDQNNRTGQHYLPVNRLSIQAVTAHIRPSANTHKHTQMHCAAVVELKIGTKLPRCNCSTESASCFAIIARGIVYVYGKTSVMGSGCTMVHLYTQKLWILFEHIYPWREKRLMNIEEVWRVSVECICLRVIVK